MEKGNKWPKAIFYDSKNTLFDWYPLWIKASSNILKRYESGIDADEFWKRWKHFHMGSGCRTAFGKYREFTEALQESLLDTLQHYGIHGSPDDIKFLLDLWDEVQPFPDTLPALRKQKEITQVFIYSNVETKYLEMMINKLGGFRPDFLGDMQQSRSCKPSPRAYRWVLENTQLEAADVLYCAGVQWDVQGAMAFGMKAAWLKRAHIKEEIQGVKPDYTVKNLYELTEIVESSIRSSK
jgi:2-haloalkanoic acid dehalogenase type II